MGLDLPGGLVLVRAEVLVEAVVPAGWVVTAPGQAPAVAVSALIVGLRYPIRQEFLATT